jgi:2-polyprenyl-6-methoxyphenol hydroxylase-like FAD-dependent oxidoreductase
VSNGDDFDSAGFDCVDVDCDVAIVGAGPVGLFAGLMLAQRGMNVRVLEAKTAPSKHSRAIGVHPPALERLAHLGVASAFCERGLQVQKGVALTYANKQLGTLDFGRCPAPYNFVLAIRQDDNEAILREALCREDAGALCWGARVTGVEQDAEGVVLELNHSRSLRCRYLLACDGKRSFVREVLGIPFHGHAYSHRYVMGDFADNTDLGERAAILLTDQGLVESFPLPAGVRRWVVQRQAHDSHVPLETDDITPIDLASAVAQRSGYHPEVSSNSMFSTFGVERYIAERFTQGRVVLMGDAAHVISPIGGQGMNVGWLGAWQVGEVLEHTLKHHATANWHSYERQQRNRANHAAKRAEFNMAATQVTPWQPVRNALVRLALHTPVRDVAARTFSMRGL